MAFFRVPQHIWTMWNLEQVRAILAQPDLNSCMSRLRPRWHKISETPTYGTYGYLWGPMALWPTRPRCLPCLNGRTFVRPASLAHSRPDPVHAEKELKIARSWKPVCSRELWQVWWMPLEVHNPWDQGWCLSTSEAYGNFPVGRNCDPERWSVCVPSPHPVLGCTALGQEMCSPLLVHGVSTSHFPVEVVLLLYSKAQPASVSGLAFACFSSSLQHQPAVSFTKHLWLIISFWKVLWDSHLAGRFTSFGVTEMQTLKATNLTSHFTSYDDPLHQGDSAPDVIILPRPGDIHVKMVLHRVARTASNYGSSWWSSFSRARDK